MKKQSSKARRLPKTNNKIKQNKRSKRRYQTIHLSKRQNLKINSQDQNFFRLKNFKTPKFTKISTNLEYNNKDSKKLIGFLRNLLELTNFTIIPEN